MQQPPAQFPAPLPSSLQDLYSELTKSAAESYGRTLWTRHAFAFDAELASIHEASGRSDLALKVYNKLQKAFVESRCQPLLLDLFPRLTHCQRVMKDWPGLLSACACALSLEPRLLSEDLRAQVLRLLLDTARDRLEQPASMEVPSLLAFAVLGGAGAESRPLPLTLSEGDPVELRVAVWSGMPAELPLDSIALTLAAPAPPGDENPGYRVRGLWGNGSWRRNGG